MPKVIHDEEVFLAAFQIFVTHGYDGTTTQDIAVAADINEATLFRKYGNKANLIAKAINHQFSTVPLSELAYTGDLKADLVKLVQAYMDTNRTHGALIPLLLSEVPRHPELRNALDMVLAYLEGIAKIIHQYQTQGFLKGDFSRDCVSVLLGPLAYQQMFLRANPDLPASTVDPDEYVDAFLHGRSSHG